MRLLSYCIEHATVGGWRDRTTDCDFVMKDLIHHYGAWVVFALVFLDWVATPRGSDPHKCCNFRRNDPQLEYRAGPCLGCGWGDTWKHHRLLDRRPVRVSLTASLRLLHRSDRNKN